MSRGGRRRKSKRGRRGPGTQDGQRGTNEEASEPREPQHSGRRRSHGRAGARETSVLDSMSSLPTSLKTLPPDGTDLDELIGALQSEYGVPATPQEYRLIIKVPAPEEHTDPSLEVKAPTVSPQSPEPEPEDDGEAAPVARQRASRRRRRGRRRAGGTAAVDGELDLADADEIDVVDELDGPEDAVS